MTGLERRKLENSQNLEFIREYLTKTELSKQIINHPRFNSILWKISTLMRKYGTKAFSKEAITLLSSIIIPKEDGSLVIIEDIGRMDFIGSTKYQFDEKDMKLRRTICNKNHDGSTTSISTYDEEGIEENLITEQKCVDGSKYYSNVTRVPDRIDMIKIERIEEVKGKRERLEDVLQIRTFCVAYEDILPDIDTIDPLDAVHLSLLGLPKIYRDLEPEELKVIDECDGEIFPLDDDNKASQLKDYMKTNRFYGRTRRFEKAVASYLSIEDRLQDFED